MTDSDKILQALLKTDDESPPDNAGAITSEQLNNELLAQQARIEKAFKKELEKMFTTFNKERKENYEKDFRDEQGIDESREVPFDAGSGNEGSKGNE